MAKHVKTFTEFITESAKWDDPTKRKIDSWFVSFDDKEKYEIRDFINAAIKNYLGNEVDKDELLGVMMKCKDKIAHNHPRKALLKCVLKHYEIEITD